MQRRVFLKLASMVVAGAIPGTRVVASARKQRVLIVGAGIAGLAAAQTLMRQGHEVLVLEARDRIGGRIWTSTRWPDAPLDLGATWIHGVKGNPLTALAATIDAATVSTSYESSIVYDTSGRPLTEAQESHLEELQEQVAAALGTAQEQDEDQSVQSAVETALNWGRLAPKDKRLVNFILNGSIEHEYAGSTAELSAHWFDADAAFGGPDALFVNGFQEIIQLLAQGVPVELGQTVEQVAWAGRQVQVTTSTATHSADRVIVTLPLGVLKAGAVRFTPALPGRKRSAIAALGMGVLNKCYLRFATAFWPTAFDWLEYIPAQRGVWTEWVSFMRTVNLPVLLGFNAADQGHAIESWTDDEIVASALQTLRIMFGRSVPLPVDYQITRWAADPFARGSYSFNALGSTPVMRDHLAESLNGKVFFAGEATERDYFSTAHGAYLSGLRAAEEVMHAA